MPARHEESRDPAEWRRHLGRKVSLRFQLRGNRDYPFSETVGVVASVDDERINLVDRRGETSSIALVDVLNAKVFD